MRFVPESRSQAVELLRRLAADGFPDIAETALILVWLRLDSGLADDVVDHLDQSQAAGQVDLQIWLTRHAPAGYLAEPASILAYTAWRAGNGVLARIACERALAEVPHHDLAQVLIELLNVGTHSRPAPPMTVFRSIARDFD